MVNTRPILVLVLLVMPVVTSAADKVAAKIDGFLESHWSAHELEPTGLSDDATFLRRLSLDLTGRIPTTDELDRFLSDKSKDKRVKAVDRLIEGPEFPLHWGSVLDGLIQSKYAGNADFVDYLRRSIRDGRSWDVVFREMMLGPWDTPERKPANRFLDKRAKTTDVLAVDTTRVFFGVDISCAQCHDHPLVEDWSQDHFYGMASFFNRTTGGKGKVGEKTEGDLKFVGSDGEEKTAQVMFLSGKVLTDTVEASTTDDSKADRPRPVSRREMLVNVALEERTFFSRAIVNRVWEYLFGRGIVHPIDQMHSGNAPAVPGLLEWLAEDFAEHGYDLKQLVAALARSRAYQLSSAWTHDSDVPEPTLFAVMPLRPLSRRQLAFSLLLATGNARLSDADDSQARVERYIGVPGYQRIAQYVMIEKQAQTLTASLDPRTGDFHSSAIEALFMSNNVVAQRLIEPVDGNLTHELSDVDNNRELITTAVRTVLSREPQAEELGRLVKWCETQTGDRSAIAGQLIWVLATSAEFRFNH